MYLWLQVGAPDSAGLSAWVLPREMMIIVKTGMWEVRKKEEKWECNCVSFRSAYLC